MNLLALDLATKTGWALSVDVSGVWDLSIRRDEDSGMRLLRFRAKLNELHATSGFDVVAFEATRHAAPGMGGAVVVQAELQGVLKVWCKEHSVSYRGYSPSEVKKRATGKGNAGKPAVVQAARERWGIEPRDDNHADALWLLDLAKNDLHLTEVSE